MIRWLGDTLMQLGSWLRRKSAPPSPTAGDALCRLRQPSSNALLAELKNIAFACAGLNSATRAAYPSRRRRCEP